MNLMARLIPAELPSSTPSSEVKVRQALTTLGNEWIVLHSVKWQSKRNGRQGDGETDFILLHPAYGILVLEVKGGSISIDQGQWYSTDRNGDRHSIKDPFQQAVSSKHALIAYLKECGKQVDQVSVVHAVAFPDITVLDGEKLGAACPKPIVWHRDSLKQITKTVQETMRHWGAACKLPNKEVEEILRLLAPTIHIRRRLSDEVADVGEALIELTEQQIWIFSQLRGVRNALVLGGAGTGKTILAVERAKKLALEGFNTLLVCYNELLGHKLREELEETDGITTSTFHALCLREAGKAGLTISRTPTEDWWEETAPALLIDAVSKTGTTYDAIIVDEGQDFSQSWLDALQLLTRQTIDAPFYIFTDHHQQLYRRSWVAPPGWTTFQLELNCRNTIPVAKKVAAIFGEEVTSRGMQGPLPKYYDTKNQSESLRLVQRFTARLMDEEKLRPNQICVLSDDAKLVSRFREIMAGDVPFVSVGENGVVCETVARYKGLESDVVILVPTDALVDDPRALAILYIGMSRAKVALFVFGSNTVKSTANWDR